MKPTLLFATLSMVLASPTVCAKSELETLRLRCSEQERQIRQLEAENSQLRSGGRGAPEQVARTESISTAQASVGAPSSSTYTVKAGDSMERIARKVGTSSVKLAKLNGLKTGAIIHPGQKLKVPGVATAPAGVASAPSPPRSGAVSHKVQAGETFASISRKHGMSINALIAANPKVKPTALRPGQVVSLGGQSSSTTMISASASKTRASAPAERAPSPAPAVVEKSSAMKETLPVSTPAPAAPAVAETETLSPTPEKKIRPVTIEGEMTYGEFASKHGTDASRLNALNGLDLTTATVLAKGSELYVPAQP